MRRLERSWLNLSRTYSALAGWGRGYPGLKPRAFSGRLFQSHSSSGRFSQSHAFTGRFFQSHIGSERFSQSHAFTGWFFGS